MPLKFIGPIIAAVAVICAGYLTTAASAAITAEVARKCQALRQSAFPPREIGNPAAGSAKGSGPEQAAFFKKCVANGGTIDEPNDRKK
jgi:hypothetical protein